MAEALRKVKQAFGGGAVIISTRTHAKGGLFGIGGRPYVEITAARHASDLPGPLRRSMIQGRSSGEKRTDGAATTMRHGPARISAPDVSGLFDEVGSLRILVEELVDDSRRARAGNVPDQLYETYQKLVGNEVAERIAQRLIERVRHDLTPKQMGDIRLVRTRLAAALESMLPTAGPIRFAERGGPMIIALVGPTGVGKTTTVAKLAANFCLRENRRVGLITIDTYRIAAIEQLRTYAQIIDVPLEVVASPEQLRDAVLRMSDREVILIDTAGRSQRDALKVKELKGFFRAVKPHETHLVLSGTCGEAVLNQTIDRFREVGVDRIIFTKLDEAIGFGVILGCLEKAEALLSYVTTGQDVPDDIEPGEGRMLARLILGTEPDGVAPVDQEGG